MRKILGPPMKTFIHPRRAYDRSITSSYRGKWKCATPRHGYWKVRPSLVKLPYIVWVTGVLKPPATNRGVSPRTDREVLCILCHEPTGIRCRNELSLTAYCEDCWRDLEYSERNNP